MEMMYDTQEMKIIRSLYVPISGTDATQRIMAFFNQSGYRQLPATDRYLYFKRGSIIGTLFNFNPTRWASVVNIRITLEENSSVIDVEMKITNDPFEKHFAEELLTSELDRMERAVNNGEFNALDVVDLKRRIAAYVYRIVGLFGSFLISVVLGIVAGMLSLTSFDVSKITALAIGTGVFVILLSICLVVWVRQKKYLT